jgi:hypothetical protein
VLPKKKKKQTEEEEIAEKNSFSLKTVCVCVCVCVCVNSSQFIIAALFIVAKQKKQSECPPNGKWVNKI